ncbi:hypothetical protein OIU74_029680 [Salix koriyanagi]|uniref:Uncharacterized protein n=1 Tax=Salix koriyanagi TaxID=2511006 RepID=A0A9Q0VF48_9ROSI|nr:hypothetical protein OIU74_029680 [Salix koriyanagi]
MVKFLFLMELENNLLTASSGDDDDTCDEVFFLLASSVGERKADFGTASDPKLAKIKRDNAITRTTNNLIAPILLSHSQKKIPDPIALKRTRDPPETL